nr:peptidoglycan DD-metalloendopeptidase family protein [Desulfobulbaceae bacterium]
MANQPPPSTIDRIRQQISSQKEKIQSSQKHELNIHKELQRMDNELKVGQEKLLFLQEQLLSQEERIQQKELEINALQAEKETIAEHVSKRLRSFYQMDEISIINTLFSASTLPQLLNLNHYFQAMFQYDKQVLHNYSSKITLLSSAQAEIIKEKENLLEVILETKKQEELLISARQERADLLARVQTEEQLYRRALAEIQVAADELAEKIDSLQVKVIRSKKRKITKLKSTKKTLPRENTEFISMQGRLAPPVQGKIIKYFGASIDRFNTEVISTGINIEVAQKTEVQAIYSGFVAFAGTMTGYGNMVIIDHGLQYHSLVSGLDSILITKGEQVETGQTIGLMGDGTTLLSNGLHFEIRHESQPVDPLPWLIDSP